MPGVPPDAVNTLKRAFKGLFRKKPKDKNGNTSSTAPESSTSASAPVQTQQQSAAATDSIRPPTTQQQSAPEVVDQQQPQLDGTKPLPPTHPLATGQHDEAQEAISTDGKESAAAPDPNVAGGPAGASVIREQGQVSPVGGNSEPVSAISPVEKDSTPATPVKEGKGMETAAHPTLAAQKLDPAAEAVTPASTATTSGDVSKENVPPTPSAPTTTTATEAAPPVATVNDMPADTTADSGKMLAAEPETSAPPPPVSASGMSATSGPLPDYPEGDHLPSTNTTAVPATPAKPSA